MVNDIERAARTAHEVLRALDRELGTNSYLKWADAPVWQKDVCRRGVEYVAQNPGVTPEDVHDHWVQGMLADGWVLGVEKSLDLMTHPALVDFDDLGAYQRAQDTMFLIVVRLALEAKSTTAG